MAKEFTVDFDINDSTPEEFEALVRRIVIKNSWKLQEISHQKIIIIVPGSYTDISEKITLQINNNHVNIESKSIGKEITESQKNKHNIEAFFQTFNEITASLTEEEIHKLPNQPIRKQKNQSPVINIQKFIKNINKDISFGYTFIILGVNLAIFILMVISGANIWSPSSEILLKWGANFRPETLNGEWWRLITSCFIHGGLLHLIFNMFALFYAGAVLESIIGKKYFIFAYLITGVMGSVASLFWHPMVVSVGASGAIFGLYGVMVVLFTSNFITKEARNQILPSIGFFIMFNLIYGLQSEIDNSAHIGGLLSGIVIGFGYYLIFTKKYFYNKKAYILIALSFIFFGTTAFVLSTTEDLFELYQKKIDRFSKNETLGLRLYTPNILGSRDTLINELLKTSIPVWTENLQISKELAAMPLNDFLRKRNRLIYDYSKLRLELMKLTLEKVQLNSTRHDVEIKELNIKISKLLDQLKLE